MTETPIDSAPDTADAQDVQITSLNRGWLIKFGLFAAVCVGLGIWGLYDAMIAFPERGRADAQFQLAEYLELAREQDGTMRSVSVADPVATFADLSARESDLKKAAAEFSALNPQSDAVKRRQLIPQVIEKEKLEWLQSLSRLGELNAASTTIDNPAAKLTELQAVKASTAQPAPLSSYDLPVQWGFVVVGFGLGGYLIFHILRSAATKYRYNPATKTITLPGSSGRTISPAVLADVDKKRWDKFYVTLTTTDGQPPVSLDLLRFEGLEAWVLELERIKFPDRAAEKTEDAAAPDSPESPAPPFPPA